MVEKTIYGLFVGMALIILPSCVKDDLFDTTHPRSGSVTVTTDWTDRSADAGIPSSYTLQIGETAQKVSEATNRFDRLLYPGSYMLTVYNVPPGMTLAGTVISVNTMADGSIEPLPGHLFTGHSAFDITADTDILLTVPMEQCTRRLELELSVVEGDYERVTSATSTLSGICGSVDTASGARSVKAMRTTAAMVREGNRFRFSYNLLGIVPEARQMLTIYITFTNGETQSIEGDLTDMLASYHDSNSLLSLSGNLLLPVESGISCVISGWQVADGGNADAH